MSNRKNIPAAKDVSSAILRILYTKMLHILQTDETDRDLTARQIAVLLALRLDPTVNTVRGLADTVGISKPAVTRALDRLSMYGLLQRSVDATDRRSVLVTLTREGVALLNALAEA